MRAYLNGLLSFFYTENGSCPVCGRVLFSEEVLCPICRTSIQEVTGPVCKGCGAPIGHEEEMYCKTCKSQTSLPGEMYGFCLYQTDEKAFSLYKRAAQGLHYELLHILGKRLAEAFLIEQKDALSEPWVMRSLPGLGIDALLLGVRESFPQEKEVTRNPKTLFLISLKCDIARQASVSAAFLSKGGMKVHCLSVFT